MKVAIKHVPGYSAGLVIVGEREGLLELASSLRAKVEQVSPDEKAELRLAETEDGQVEWIGVQVVRDVHAEMKANEEKRFPSWGCWALCAVAAILLVLACIGLMSLA